MSNLTQRIITGIIGGGIMVGAILWNEYSFSALFLFITIMSMLEFYSLWRKNEIHPQSLFGIIIGIFVFVFFSAFMNFIPRNVFIIIIPLVFFVFIMELFRDLPNPFMNIAITLIAVIYLAIPMTLMNLISLGRSLEVYHPHIVLGYLFLVWSSDTGAYFAGKKFGKRKLFERISPGKTWEGSVGGTLFALIIAYVLSMYFIELRLTDWIAITLIVVVTGTLGDLVESMFKRSINIKDSGSFIPGHGGFLDRFDAFFISAPFVFTYLQLIY